MAGIFAGKKKGKAEKKEVRKARKQEMMGGTGGLPRLPPTAEELERVGARVDDRYSSRSWFAV